MKNYYIKDITPRRTKNIVSSIVPLLPLIVFVFLATSLNTLQAQFSGGSGTSADPYQISTLADLQAMGDAAYMSDPNVYFILTNDIDASATSSWNGGLGFKPIADVVQIYDPWFGGVYNNPLFFQGHFNGKGYTISNLYINRPSANSVGLFEELRYGATIDSVNLANIDFFGRLETGGLAGASHSANTISHSSVTGKITTGNTTTGNTTSYIGSGGLVGDVGGVIDISNCFADVEFILNDPNSSSSSKCDIGGLIGRALGTSTIMVSNCYAISNISGNIADGQVYYGGICGRTGNSETINATYAVTVNTATTSGTEHKGGIIGNTPNTPSGLTFTYWNTDSTTNTTSGAAGLSTAQMLLHI